MISLLLERLGPISDDLRACGNAFDSSSIDRSVPQGRVSTHGSNENRRRVYNLLAAERHMTNQMLLNGSGVCAGDVDRDTVDLYFTSLDGPNRLTAIEASGVLKISPWQPDWTARERSTACAFADLDGDADLNLLVHTMYRGLRVFQNTGELNFTEKTQTTGMVAAKGGMSLAVADYDLDGDLDIYVTRYRSEAMMDEVSNGSDQDRGYERSVVTSTIGRPPIPTCATGFTSISAVALVNMEKWTHSPKPGRVCL